MLIGVVGVIVCVDVEDVVFVFCLGEFFVILGVLCGLFVR